METPSVTKHYAGSATLTRGTNSSQVQYKSPLFFPPLKNAQFHGTRTFKPTTERIDSYNSKNTSASSASTSLSSETSLSTTQPELPMKQPPSKSSQMITTWVTDWWGIELVCWLIAALSLLAMVVMLETHKNKPLPEWPLKITLNSFISIFATIGHMAMMKPVVECISQLKWLFFVRKERLSGFEAFDNASRGPTGSLILLGKLRGLHLVTLGAVITIISIAFGPFSQQIVSYPARQRPVAIATTPQVLSYTGAADRSNGEDNPIILAAVYEALSGTHNLSTVNPFCSTGNCTWTEYSSIGMCANVVDLSDSILNNTCNETALDAIFATQGSQNPGYPCYNYTIPYVAVNFLDTEGDGLGSISISNVSLSSAAPSDTGIDYLTLEVAAISQGASNSSLAEYYLIYQPNLVESMNNGSLGKPVAYRLSLDFCLHTYNTTVTNGKTETNLTSSRILDLSVAEFLTPRIPNDGVIFVKTFQNATIPRISGLEKFTVSPDGAASLATGTSQAIPGPCFSVIGDYSQSQIVLTECFSSGGTTLINAISNSTDPFLAVSRVMDNIATSLTNTFRNGGGGDTLVVSFEGIALGPIDYVETQYLWLLLPIALVCLTLVFLLATITKSQRLGSRVWKSSNLATLQGLHLDLHTKLGGLSSISEMEENAENIKIRFDMAGGKVEHGVEYRLVEEKRDVYWSG